MNGSECNGERDIFSHCTLSASAPLLLDMELIWIILPAKSLRIGFLADYQRVSTVATSFAALITRV